MFPPILFYQMCQNISLSLLGLNLHDLSYALLHIPLQLFPRKKKETSLKQECMKQSHDSRWKYQYSI